jgi:hypothetical protein
VFIIYLLAVLLGYSSHAQQVESSDLVEYKFQPNPAQTYIPLVLNFALTMRSGAENMTSLHKGIDILDSKYIGTKWFNENSIIGKSGGVLARFAKYYFLDLPVDHFSVVFAHEYFGHGARYREFDISNIHYAYDYPPPYGNGGGEATNRRSVNVSPEEILAIWQGGIEIHPLINRNLSMRWMAKNEMTYREASQYWNSFQIMFSYIQDSDANLSDGQSDNDPRAYVRLINEFNGYNDVHNLKMNVKDLKSKMMWNLVNPFIVYSMYSMFKTFLWDGDNVNTIPTINIGDVKYLPALRAGLTPFGVEYHFENYIRTNELVSFVDFSYGDQSFHDSWGGVGVKLQNIYSTPNFVFDLNMNLWKQPGLRFESGDRTVDGDGVGGAFSIRTYYNFENSESALTGIVELGYKSVGFIEGYVMDSSPIFQIGLAIRN